MESPTIGIGRLLREAGRFFIPPHQRDFSWTEDEIEQLIVDIEDSRRLNQPEYFVGLMVFMPTGPRKYTILDGQQRLVTTTILLAGIRSWLNDNGFPVDAAQIQSTYIASRELGSQEYSPLLVLNQQNNPCFIRFVVNEASQDELTTTIDGLKRYDPNRRLLEAVLLCRSRVNTLAGEGISPQEGAQRLFSLVRYFEDGVKIVRLAVPSEANAYTVFETLNDRGLDLSVLDLVKNHVFGRAGSVTRLRDIQGLWTQMMANLAGVPADEFLKAWWTTRFGRVQAPQLFPQFKNKVSTADDTDRVSADMLRASEIYAVLDIADDPLWSGLTPKARQRIRFLRLLGAQQLRPVLLAAVDRMTSGEQERLLHLLEVLIVRYQLIGGGRTGRLEISCARLANRIFLGEVTTASAAREVLRDIMPSDDEFRGAFLLKQERNNQKVKYILTCLEIQARRAEGIAALGDELEPSSTLTIEHIFPKGIGAAWRPVVDADPTVPDECTYKLGNICLLTSINKSLGTAPFDEKKGAFTKSDLILTREIAAEAVWNRRSIDQRQARLAGLAVAFWRFQ